MKGTGRRIGLGAIGKGHRERLWKLAPEICRLFKESSLTTQQIADLLGGTYKHTGNVIAKNFSRSERTSKKKQNYSRSKLGENNPQFGKFREQAAGWKGGKMRDSHGYKMVLKPKWYTARKGYNYIYEHHFVFCTANNITQIPAGYCLHHINFDIDCNEIRNLKLMTMSEHSIYHNWIKAMLFPYEVRENNAKRNSLIKPKLHIRLKKGAETIPKGSRCQATSKYLGHKDAKI